MWTQTFYKNKWSECKSLIQLCMNSGDERRVKNYQREVKVSHSSRERRWWSAILYLDRRRRWYLWLEGTQHFWSSLSMKRITGPNYCQFISKSWGESIWRESKDLRAIFETAIKKAKETEKVLEPPMWRMLVQER